MASASKETVAREVVTTVEDEEVVLRLSMEEAEVLRIMVGSTNFQSPVEVTDWKHPEAIRAALIDAGVGVNRDMRDRTRGTIEFLPAPVLASTSRPLEVGDRVMVMEGATWVPGFERRPTPPSMIGKPGGVVTVLDSDGDVVINLDNGSTAYSDPEHVRHI